MKIFCGNFWSAEIDFEGQYWFAGYMLVRYDSTSQRVLLSDYPSSCDPGGGFFSK